VRCVFITLPAGPRRSRRGTRAVRMHARHARRAPRRKRPDAPSAALQGGWETDETSAEAAARESLEEAGVRGELQARACALPPPDAHPTHARRRRRWPPCASPCV
jgi:8-oxo-dGTP pyrophosphatase MutT (NUDIX family)